MAGEFDDFIKQQQPKGEFDTFIREQNKSPFDVKIKKHAEASGLDDDLVRRMSGQESNHNPNVTSWTEKHTGLMQVSGDVINRFVKQEEFGTLDPKNPDVNLAGGTRYYKWLLDRYKGDHKRALAGYNAGEGNADKNDWWEKSVYWSNDPNVQAGRKPRGETDKTNTRNYIDKITGNYSGNGYRRKNGTGEFSSFLQSQPSGEFDSFIKNQSPEIETPQNDILGNLSAQRADLENQLKTVRSSNDKARINAALKTLDNSIAQTKNELNLNPSASDIQTTAPSPTFPQNAAPSPNEQLNLAASVPTGQLTPDPYVQGVIDGTISTPNPFAKIAAVEEKRNLRTSNPKTKSQNVLAPPQTIQLTVSPNPEDAEYKAYLSFKGVPDTAENYAQFNRELSENKTFGSNVEIEARTDEEQRALEAEQQPQEKQDFFAEKPSVEADKIGGALNGSAGNVSVDVAQKPAGINAGSWMLNQALKQIAPQYDFTDAEIDSYTTANQGNSTWDKITDADLPAELERQKAQKGNTNVDVYVTNQNINDILQRRNAATATR